MYITMPGFLHPVAHPSSVRLAPNPARREAHAPDSNRSRIVAELKCAAVEIDPVSIDSTFFVVPNRGAERAYAPLYDARCRSGLFGVARITMHSRESVVVLRQCGNGIVAQTLFYEP